MRNITKLTSFGQVWITEGQRGTNQEAQIINNQPVKKAKTQPVVNENMMQLFAPQIFNPFPQNSPLISCPQPVMPANLTKPPSLWSKEEVGAWLAWCAEEFSIDSVSPERFNMNGRAVCLLKRDDFMQRSPEAGDVLYNALQMLIKRQLPMPVLKPRNNGFSSPTPLQTTIQSQPFMLMAGNQKLSTTTANTTSGPFLTPPLTSPVTTVPSLQQIDYNVNNMSNNTPTGIVNSPVSSTVDVESVPSEASSNPDPEEVDIPMDQEIRETELPDNRKQDPLSNNKGNTGTKRDSDCRLLWEFIYHLLLNNEYSTYICWDNKERFIFRIVNPHGLAKLWGNQKSRSTMTYEKLSRALRYYYKMEIIKKVPGQRLTYQFMQSPKDIKKGQRGARPHYRHEQLYFNSCRSTQSGSEQNETNDLCNHQAPSTSSRRNSNNNHGVLAYSNDLHNSNAHMISDGTSVIKPATGVDHLHSNGMNMDQGHLAFIPTHGQVMENSIDRNFATNSKLSRVSSPSAFMGTASSSPLRTNESPQGVLLKSSDIKTEQGFMPFNNGECPVPQLPDYADTFHLEWTETTIQEEPEDLSMGTRQRIPNMDTISHSTPVEDA